MVSLATDAAGQVGMVAVEAMMVKLLSGSDGVMKQAALHHLGSGGARVRAGLALQSASALSLSSQTACALSAACELLHNASLVHDDLQDGDALRRDEMAVWKRFGPNAAICLGDLMVSAAYAAIANAATERLPEMIAHTHQRVSSVIGGQHADLASDCPTIADYNEIVRMKSGPLLGLPVELCLLAANLTEQVSAAIKASDAIAIAYQITDDISDVEKDIDSGGLNFLALLHSDMPSRVRTARVQAADYACAAITVAKTLPEGSGEGLVFLAEKFTPALMLGEVA